MSGSVLDLAASIGPDLALLRRALHRIPEPGLHLSQTQRTVLEALDGLGLDITLPPLMTACRRSSPSFRTASRPDGPGGLLAGIVEADGLVGVPGRIGDLLLGSRRHRLVLFENLELVVGLLDHVISLVGTVSLLNESRGRQQGRAQPVLCYVKLLDNMESNF